MKPTYLGDSVYAEIESGMIKLTTNNGYGPTNTMFLDGGVYAALVAYVEALTPNSPTDSPAPDEIVGNDTIL